MRRLLVASIVLGVAVLGEAAAHARESRVVVAWDDVAAGRSYVAAARGAAPFELVTAALEVPPDGVVRVAFGRVFHVSRTAGVITVIDAVSWTAVRSIPLGASSEPRDIAVVDPATAYVTRRSADALLRVDLASGTATPAVDMTPLGVSNGDLAMETMLVHAGRLYVQLPRPAGSPLASHVAVIDLATEQIVDADPVQPGLQAVPLVGTPPRLKMQVVPGTDRLLLSATGSSLDFGGLEAIDLVGLVSEGLVLEEFIDTPLNDVGPFTMVDDARGWYSGSTDIVLSSHLHTFTLSGGGNVAETASVLFYFAPHVVYDGTTDTVFWPVPNGLRAFDASTGSERTPAPIAISGEPTDIALLPAGVEVSVLPIAGIGILAAALAGLGVARLARAGA